jgi:hypothetical protein
MRCLSMMTICAVILFAASGCQMCRRIDQWKCDKLGICMCGVQPTSQQVCVPYSPPVLDPCCQEQMDSPPVAMPCP